MSRTRSTVAASTIVVAVASSCTPDAARRTVGVLSTFLYQPLSDPVTGTRYSFSPSLANHTGREISRPDVRPVTVSSISRLDFRAFLNSSFAMRLPFL
jgi:hypothetical protein